MFINEAGDRVVVYGALFEGNEFLSRNSIYSYTKKLDVFIIIHIILLPSTSVSYSFEKSRIKPLHNGAPFYSSF